MSRDRRRIVVPLAVLAVGALGVALLVATQEEPAPQPKEVLAPLVHVERVAPQRYHFLVHAQGTVTPRTESELVPQVSGEVVWVSPSLVDGGFFEAGEPLLRIDRADYEAGLERARAELARAESEERRARKELDRQLRLAVRDVASEAKIDDAKNAHQIARANLAEARVRLTTAERDLERTEVRAPYAGRVRRETVDVGQFASRGVAMASLYAVDWAEVRLPLPDRELRYLDVPLRYRPVGKEPDAGSEDATTGPEVLLHAEFAGRRHAWKGRIVRTEGEIDPKSRMVTLVARVEDPYGRVGPEARPPLAVGLFVDAEISGRVVEAAFVLPRAALRSTATVLVVGRDDRLEIRPVEILRKEGERVVIGGGLRAGERVCITSLPGAIDGMTVRAAETEVVAGGPAP